MKKTARACVDVLSTEGQLIGNLPAEELVPGDLMYLRVGDKVGLPAPSPPLPQELALLSRGHGGWPHI